MTYQEVPDNEIKLLQNQIKLNSHLLKTKVVTNLYIENGNKVICSPFGSAVVKLICDALDNKYPQSIIRVGDGEINLITYSFYTLTPNLNYFVAQKSLARRCHRFNANRVWLKRLQDIMIKALYQADVIGLLGLWRPKPIHVKDFISKIAHPEFCRGLSGQFRGVEFMIHHAKRGNFNNKILTSAHLYFSIIKNLSVIFSHVKDVYLITNNQSIVVKLRNAYPNNKFFHIDIKETPEPIINKSPDFFNEFLALLPTDMKGSLSLVGAGVWSQIYCGWIKLRGGVSVDIGSGFDLMDGQLTRRIQRRMDFKEIKEFFITKNIYSENIE